MRRPVIGISGNLIPIENDGVFTGNLRQYIHTDYTSSVERAGGTPLLLPVCDDPEVIRAHAQLCDGIILSLAKSTTSFEHIQNIINTGVPLVLFDRTTKELNVSKVVADDADAAYRVVMHLIHGGARKIAILTGAEHLSIGKNRLKGYKKAMTDSGLEIYPDLIVRCDDFSVPAAKEAVLKLLDSEHVPDAIFGINDDMAIGALEAVKEKGLRIPEDVAIFGFSNSKRSRYMTPSVSTINQFPEKVGEKAAELLFEQILDPRHARIREEVINCELIVRESSDRSYLEK